MTPKLIYPSKDIIRECLDHYEFETGIMLAQCLYSLKNDHDSLHQLFNAHMRKGDFETVIVMAEHYGAPTKEIQYLCAMAAFKLGKTEACDRFIADLLLRDASPPSASCSSTSTSAGSGGQNPPSSSTSCSMEQHLRNASMARHPSSTIMGQPSRKAEATFSSNNSNPAADESRRQLLFSFAHKLRGDHLYTKSPNFVKEAQSEWHESLKLNPYLWSAFNRLSCTEPSTRPDLADVFKVSDHDVIMAASSDLAAVRIDTVVNSSSSGSPQLAVLNESTRGDESRHLKPFESTPTPPNCNQFVIGEESTKKTSTKTTTTGNSQTGGSGGQLGGGGGPPKAPRKVRKNVMNSYGGETRRVTRQTRRSQAAMDENVSNHLPSSGGGIHNTTRRSPRLSQTVIGERGIQSKNRRSSKTGLQKLNESSLSNVMKQGGVNNVGGYGGRGEGGGGDEEENPPPPSSGELNNEDDENDDGENRQQQTKETLGSRFIDDAMDFELKPRALKFPPSLKSENIKDLSSSETTIKSAAVVQGDTTIPLDTTNVLGSAVETGGIDNSKKTGQQCSQCGQLIGSKVVAAIKVQKTAGVSVAQEDTKPKAKAEAVSLIQPRRSSELLQFLHELSPAWLKFGSNQWREARQEIQSMSEKVRNCPQVLLLEAKTYQEAAEYRKAARAFDTLRQRYPYVVDGMELLSTVLWHLQDTHQLTALAHRMTTNWKHAYQTWCVNGNCYSLVGDHETAVTHLQRAVQIKQDPIAYTLLGFEYLALEQVERSKVAFRSAIQQNGRCYTAWYGLGLAFSRQESHSIALYNFRRAHDIDPSNPIILCQMAEMEQMRGRPEDALRWLNASLAVNADNSISLFHRAQILYSLNRYTEALADIKRLKILAPAEGPVYFLAGKIYKSMEEEDLAVLNITWAAELDPRGAAASPVNFAVRRDSSATSS